MADPNHIPQMTSLDRLTVVLYRVGLTLIALSSLWFALEGLLALSVLGRWYLPLLALGSTLTAANLHLYDPRFRWLMPMMSWLGLLALVFSAQFEVGRMHMLLELAAQGAFYAGAAMFAMKEYYCFKIPGLPLVPFCLAAVIVCSLLGWSLAADLCLLLAASLYTLMALYKWRMPLHFDIGDKRNYHF